MKAIEAGVIPRRAGFQYANRDELLARHGQKFQWSPGELPDGVPSGKLGECFLNAGRLALSSDYRYCEGYAVTDGGLIPVPHAWVIDEAGNVVDNTWHHFDEDRERQYLGVIVSMKRLAASTVRRGKWGVLDDPEMYTKAWEEAQ